MGAKRRRRVVSRHDTTATRERSGECSRSCSDVKFNFRYAGICQGRRGTAGEEICPALNFVNLFVERN